MTTTAEIQTAHRLRTDPIFFVTEVLGGKPWDKQREILESVRDNPRTSVQSCEGSGKSWVEAHTALWFLYTHQPSTVITTAPTWRQVRDILWREMAGGYNRARYPLGGTLLQTELKVDDDWFAFGIATDKPENFLGRHNQHVLVIVDEASGVDEQIFEVIENPLSTGHTRLLLAGNPTQPAGTFYDACNRSELYNRVRISCFDTPNFTEFGITLDDIKSGEWKDKVGKLPYPTLTHPAAVASNYEEHGEGSYRFQVFSLGNFPEAGTNNLFKLSDIDAAIDRDLPTEGPKVVSVDVSRYGDDETVLMARQGDRVFHVDSWGHQDTVFTAGRVARYLREQEISVCKVDSVGVGAGVVDALRSQGLNVVEVNVGEQALDREQFLNRRAELYWLLMKKFEDEAIDIPNHSKLKAQLLDIRYDYNTKGQLIIEPKEKARARGSKSPDYADALMMLFDPASHASSVSEIWRWD